MAKHPTSSRVHREDTGPDDAFVSSIKHSYIWARQNSRLLVIAIVAIVVIAGGGFWYIAQQRQLEAQASARMNQVHQTVATGNTELAIRELQRYLDRFGGTRTADQARLLLASILVGQDRPQEALEALGSLPDKIDKPFGLAAARLQAAAFEAAGDAPGAVDTYGRIADQARFAFEQREALADAARVNLQHGDPSAAARLYERVVNTFDPDEPGRGYYEMWLAEARAQAEKGIAVTSGTAETATSSDPEPTG